MNQQFVSRWSSVFSDKPSDPAQRGCVRGHRHLPWNCGGFWYKLFILYIVIVSHYIYIYTYTMIYIYMYIYRHYITYIYICTEWITIVYKSFSLVATFWPQPLSAFVFPRRWGIHWTWTTACTRRHGCRRKFRIYPGVNRDIYPDLRGF